MFTGIIETTGILQDRISHSNDCTLVIQSTDFDFKRCNQGDSIAVNGVCLTAVALGNDYFQADVSTETLSITTLGRLYPGQAVNLERALSLSAPLGGHLVSGHTDGIGELIARRPESRSERLSFRIPAKLSRYIAHKGSITLDGISLTVNDIKDDTFTVNIVPHTMQRTTLAHLDIGHQVNVEVDIIARYLERLLNCPNESGLSFAKLQRLGF